MVEEGIIRRFPNGVPAKVREQIEHELELIAELRYEPYFLTVYDIVRFARSQDILCQGRGSAANSAVCYCLGITEVDPARSNLLFERFISKERNEPPDIDVDFEHQRREEVIQYIYDKYGRERAALAAAVITYRTASRCATSARRSASISTASTAVRLVCLVGQQLRMIRQRLAENGFDPDSSVIRKLFQLTSQLYGFPRHLSQHLGGFVITRDKLCRLVPIENAAMAERRSSSGTRTTSKRWGC